MWKRVLSVCVWTRVYVCMCACGNRLMREYICVERALYVCVWKRAYECVCVCVCGQDLMCVCGKRLMSVFVCVEKGV